MDKYSAIRTWEYKLVNVNVDLNKYGARGWEAVGLSGHDVLLKRPTEYINKRS